MNHNEAIQHIQATLKAFGPGEAITLTQDTWAHLHAAMTALIEQPEQEPVARLKRGTTGRCTRRVCECEKEGLGLECIWLEPMIDGTSTYVTDRRVDAEEAAAEGWVRTPLYTAPTPQREHITDGSPCWCNPDVFEEDGGDVIVHNYADNWQQYAKPGETAQQCIERHRSEQDALMKLYATPRKPVGQLQEEAYGRGQVLWFKKPADQSMLYTAAPAPRKPLSEKEMYVVEEEARKNFRLSQRGPRGQQITYWDGLTPWLIRAVEAAHGVGEQT